MYNRTKLVRKDGGFRGSVDFELMLFFRRGGGFRMKKGIRRIGRDASIVGNIKFRRNQRRVDARNSSFSKSVFDISSVRL